jgi:hypothetical protein
MYITNIFEEALFMYKAPSKYIRKFFQVLYATWSKELKMMILNEIFSKEIGGDQASCLWFDNSKHRLLLLCMSMQDS